LSRLRREGHVYTNFTSGIKVKEKLKNIIKEETILLKKPTLISPAGELVSPQARGCRGRTRRISFLFSII